MPTKSKRYCCRSNHNNKKGIDNTQIISANLDNFNMGLKIKSVKEDDKFYYVSFDYNAIDAKDNVWQVVKKKKT